MYTVIQITSILTAIITFSVFFIYMIIFALDCLSGDNYETLKRRPIHFLVFGFLIVFSILGAFISSRHLAEFNCKQNQGVFRSWDSGAAWECYNPDLIQQNNNFRIITDNQGD